MRPAERKALAAEAAQAGAKALRETFAEATKAKGPASAATDPDHGSDIPQGRKMPMNAKEDSTTGFKVPEFPLYAVNQGPDDDLAKVCGTLRIIAHVLEDCTENRLSTSIAIDLLALLRDAIDTIRPIQALLDDQDGALLPDYRECRRLVILERGQAAGGAA